MLCGFEQGCSHLPSRASAHLLDGAADPAAGSDAALHAVSHCEAKGVRVAHGASHEVRRDLRRLKEEAWRRLRVGGQAQEHIVVMVTGKLAKGTQGLWLNGAGDSDDEP